MELEIPANIFPSIPKLDLDSGPRAYLVGGAVRDLIRGVQPLDYDIVVTSDPERFARHLADGVGGRLVALGKDPFRLFRVVTGHGLIDVTAMKGPGIDTDLLARDFTINALACELATKTVIDCTSGLEDIEQGVVRAVSSESLQSDPVRMLRAYRMAVMFKFQIEPRTRDLISRSAHLIQSAAGERIWSELQAILGSADSHTQIISMAHTGLLSAIFPELEALRHCQQNHHHTEDVFDHTLAAYEAIESIMEHAIDDLAESTAPFIETMFPQNRILLKLAILLHDVGKPACRSSDADGKIHFYRHADQGTKMTHQICGRLRTSKHQREWVEFIVRHHQDPLSLFLGFTPKAMGRFFRVCATRTPYVLLHAMADTLGKKPGGSADSAAMISFLNKMFTKYNESLADNSKGKALLGGKDLIDHFGLRPSPLFGTLIESIEEARLAGEITTRDQALGWVRKYLGKKE